MKILLILYWGFALSMIQEVLQVQTMEEDEDAADVLVLEEDDAFS